MSSLAFPKDADFCEPSPKEKKAIRERLYDERGGCCERCKVPVRKESGRWESAQLHHIQGGIHRKDWHDENLLLLCLGCHFSEHNPRAVRSKGTS